MIKTPKKVEVTQKDASFVTEENVLAVPKKLDISLVGISLVNLFTVEPKTTVEVKTEVAIETQTEVAIETQTEVVIETQTEVVSETQAEVAIETQTEVVIETQAEVAIETQAEVVIETQSEVTTEPEMIDAVAERNKETELIRNFYNDVDCSYDMTKRIGISKERFVEILTWLPYDYAGVYEENAEFLWEIAHKYDFNEFLMIGIMAQESLWCSKPVAKNNFSSQRISGSRYYSYDTQEEGIETLAKNLADNYLQENGKFYAGKNLNAIGVRYCEGNTWAGKVLECINKVLKEYLNTV